MTPLEVTATVRGAISLPHGPLALDALLAWAVAQRLGLPPAGIGELQPIEIPVQREPEARFHLCSFSVSEAELYERRWTHRRFPVPEAMVLAGLKLRRIDERAGPQKAYRLPLETQHVAGDQLHWWCYGEPEPIRELLTLIGYLGKRRAVGLGRVVRWDVGSCAPWGEGFPVVRDGLPLRSLPLDWPGVVEDACIGVKTMTYPYWRHEAEEPCYVPL